ncbi:T6SS immunity protein Tli4 family protein [Zoogloeaceae bacterium G21618-S1]|nr:T6SS immunity protein Tli4 family protein [Zoogloeaceae bacterium G21618-S1]
MTLRHIALVLATPFLLFAAGCSEDATPASPKEAMTDAQAIATRPLCIGRFLIDVPAETRVTWTDTRTALAGVIKREGTLSENAFSTRMRREQERVGGPVSEDASLLKEVREINDGQGRVLVFRDAPSNDLYFDMKAFVLVQGTLFSLFGQAEDAKLSSAIRDIEKGLSMLKHRDTWTIPTDRGFCFDGGFLPGGDGGFEATGVQLTFKAYPGLVVFMETRVRSASPVEEASLIERTDAAMKLMDASDKPTVLRRRNERSVAFGTAEEVLWKHRQGDHYTLKGDVEMNGLDGATDKPDLAFSIVLDPAKDGTEQPEEGAVLRLWDSVVESLRLRPGAV